MPAGLTSGHGVRTDGERFPCCRRRGGDGPSPPGRTPAGVPRGSLAAVTSAGPPPGAAAVPMRQGRAAPRRMESETGAQPGPSGLGSCRHESLRRHAACLAGAQREDGGCERDDDAGQQRPLEAGGERDGWRRVGCQQLAGAGGGDGGEDRPAERPADVLAGVEERGSQIGLVGGYVGSGGGHGGYEDGAEIDRHDAHAREPVAEAGAVDRDAREDIEAGGGDQTAGDDDRSCARAAPELGGDAGGDADTDAEAKARRTGGRSSFAPFPTGTRSWCACSRR